MLIATYADVCVCVCHPCVCMPQEPQWVVGRVVCGSEVSGPLSAEVVMLEGSREASGGARVKLDLSGIPAYRLFPGQVWGGACVCV